MAEAKLRRIEQQNQELSQALPKLPRLSFDANRFGPLMFALVLGLGGVFYMLSSLAAPAGQPSRGSLIAELPSTTTPGQLVSVDVWADSFDQPVEKVQAYLMYPEADLEFVSADTASSAFRFDDAIEHSNGQVLISRSADEAQSLTGRQLVGRLTFRAKQSSVAALKFSQDSRLFRKGDRINLLTVNPPAAP